MLKQTFTYEDFDGYRVTEDLYFNLTKVELSENIWLRDKVEALRVMLDGPARDLKESETFQILELVKEIMRLAYGVRSDDGKRFRKSEEIWKDFSESAAYDAFLFSLFETPEKANQFILGIMPRDLAEAASKMAANQQSAESLGRVAENSARVEEIRKAETTVDIGEVTVTNLQKDPKDMSREELLAAFKAKSES